MGSTGGRAIWARCWLGLPLLSSSHRGQGRAQYRQCGRAAGPSLFRSTFPHLRSGLFLSLGPWPRCTVYSPSPLMPVGRVPVAFPGGLPAATLSWQLCGPGASGPPKHFYVGGCVHDTAYVWRSEDNFQEMVLSFHHIGLKNQTQTVRLSTNHFTC